MSKWNQGNTSQQKQESAPAQEGDLMSRWGEKPNAGCGGCNQEVNESMTLEQLHDMAERTASDINEHVPKLRELASQCDHVTEFGHRHSVSSVALLSGQPKRFITYDPNDDFTVKRLAKVAGETDFEFRIGDSLEVEIEETDLLFIDTLHNADRLYAELEKHAPNVCRFIAMHDTSIYGERGDNGGPGLLPAMRRFMSEQPQWSVIYHTTDNNGFTVIGSQAEDKPKLPGKIEMATNFAKALKGHVADGLKMVESDELKRRLEICSICPHRVNNRCSICGCPVDKKASWKEQVCPIGKWEEND